MSGHFMTSSRGNLDCRGNREVRARIEGAGFHMDVVESVNVHDDIKIGLPTRDQYIENYKTTLKNLAQFGVKVVTYNFMPIFDWTRTDLFHPLEDGSTALYYEKNKIQDDYKEMAAYILENLHGKTFPDGNRSGWQNWMNFLKRIAR